MIRVKFGKGFDKKYQDLVKTDEDLRQLTFLKIELFKNNPDDTRLDNHPLKKKMEGKWAFSITDNIRIVYEFAGKNTVRFLAIGGHEKVY